MLALLAFGKTSAAILGANRAVPYLRYPDKVLIAFASATSQGNI
jgi:hypothetical protein